MKKIGLGFAVTPKNILLRYLREKNKNPLFGFLDVAKKFGIVNSKGELQKGVAWKWTESGVHKRKPNQTVRCPQCNKTQHDRVFKWINDGELNK
ncbi:MAG: hypothetical protein V3V70_07390 [Candidatus Scalindua sp.]|jgi:hypothetical protein|tara:strand:+ start:608 stop:889 length:282 start_codon:yes stop_codon:yes gene_type:complete